MAFINAKTGEKIKLGTGYTSNPIDYQTFVKQQEERRRSAASAEPAAPAKGKREVSGAAVNRARSAPELSALSPSRLGQQYQEALGRAVSSPASPSGLLQTPRKPQSPVNRSGYSAGQGILDIFKKGANQVAQAGADTLALAEDVIHAPFELLSGMELGSLRNSGEGIFNPLSEKVREEGTALAEKSAENIRKGGKVAAALDKYGTATVAAVPQAILAMLTGGSSAAAQAAAQTTGGVARAAASSLSPGITQTIRNVVGGLARDPQYWSSFSQVVGSGYRQALEDGASVPKAALYAVGNGLMNAAVEVGGGVETLPGELRAGASGWRALVDSALDEGKEEVVQGVIERAMQNLSYQKGNPLASVRNPDAVFNPLTAAEEFAGGAVVGGILSGGQIAAQSAINARADKRVQSTLELMRRAAGQEAAQEAPGARPKAGAGTDTTQAQNAAGAAQTGPENIFTQTAAAAKEEGDRRVRGTLELMQRAAGMETGQQKAAPGAGTAVNENGLTALSQLERENLSSGKRNKVISTFSEAVNFVKNAIRNKQTVDRAYLGKVPDSVAEAVLSDTGIDIRGYGAIMNGNDVRHIMRNHGDPFMETARGQIAVTPEDIAKIPEILSSPDKVYLSDSLDGKGRKALIFEKQIGDRLITLQGVSDGKKALQTDTLYIQQGRARTTRDTMPGAQSDTVPVINAQSEPPQSSSIDSTIPQGADSVKPGGTDGLGAADAGQPGSQAFVDLEAPKNDGLGNANKGFDSMSAADRIHGVLPDGEKAVRPDDVPARTTDQNRVSLLARTIKGARVTPDSFVPVLEKAILDGKFSYIPHTNAEAAAKAQETIAYKGWNQALADFTAAVAEGKASDSLTAEGVELYNNAVNSGDIVTALNVLDSLQKTARNAGQAAQAVRLLKSASPAHRLYMMQKSVQSMVDAMNLPEGSVKLDESLLKAYLEAKDDAARDKVISDIQQDVADQLPSSLLDKWTALRYVNMLGNFKTQVRNIFGNAGMQGVRAVKDLTAASLEGIYSKFNPKAQRTKSAFVGKELMDAAKADYANVEDAALGEGKYQEGFSNEAFARGVDEKRTIFKNSGTWGTEQGKSAFQRSAPMKLARQTTDVLWKVSEAYRDITNWAMTKDDKVFTKHTYARALAGYLKANKVTAEQFSSPEWQAKNAKFVDKARMYAIQEAQEATFRDSNFFSNWVSQIGRGKKTPKLVRVLSEGMAPFRKTPANVLARAEEYSPLGIANTIYEAVQAKRGNATGADVINSLAKTLTGSALMAAGLGLFKGLIPGVKIRGGDDDDDRQRSFDDLTGRQSYSIELDNGWSYTLDWLSPGAMPFFMGVQLGELMDKEGLELKDLEGALTSIADPMLQMSMLQGVNDTLDSLKFSDDNLGQIGVSMALNYLTQGLSNSLVGQVERTLDPERQTTYIDKESLAPSWLQREIGKFSAKTPKWDYNQIPYINAWGETESNGSVGERIATNFFSPGYMSRVQTGKVEQELQRVADMTGTTSVFPSRAKQSFTFSKTDAKGETVKDANGNPVKVTKNLTAEEYQTYARKRGQTALEVLRSMLESPGYQKLSDEKKAEAISGAYSYADAIGKMAVSDYRPGDGTVAAGALKTMLPPAGYILYQINKDRDGDGKVTNLESTQTLQELSGLTDRQRGEAWAAMNPTAKPAKNPFTGVLAEQGMTPEDAAAAWGIYGRRGTEEEPYTKAEKKQDLTTQEVDRLWNLMVRAAERK